MFKTDGWMVDVLTPVFAFVLCSLHHSFTFKFLRFVVPKRRRATGHYSGSEGTSIQQTYCTQSYTYQSILNLQTFSTKMIGASSQFLSRLITKKLVTTRRPPPLFLVSFSSSSSSSTLSSSNDNNKYLQLNAGRVQHNATNSKSNNNDNNNTSRTYSNSAKVTFQPMEDLYLQSKKGTAIGQQDLVGKTASINRVFGPGASAQALLTCGGEELAQYASFDPNYETAKDWIRSRPVGPAVLSSTLISGLVGALIEASFPQTVPVNSSLNFIRPLIVGCEVSARIQVESVNETQRDNINNNNNNNNKTTTTAASTEQKGYEIILSTQVIRVQDDIVIAEGYHTVWIPSYL